MRPLRPLLTLLVLLFATAAPAQAADDCATPRAAIQTWIDNLQTDNSRPDLAVQCFDWSGGPAEASERARVARQLLGVLDGNGKYVVYDVIPAEPDYMDPGSGLPRYVLFPTLSEIYVEKASGGWMISASSVQNADRLFERTFRVPLERFVQLLPDSFRQSIAGIAVWQWLALALLILLGAVIGRVLEILLVGILRRLIQRWFKEWDEALEKAVMRRIGLLLGTALIGLVLPSLGLPVRLNQVLLIAVKLVVSVSAVLIVSALLDLVFGAWGRRANETQTKMDDQLIPLLRRASKLIALLVGAMFVLQNLDVDVGSLLAGLGLGGLAFALAAKDTLANFFGSLTIFADRPFQIGDWILIGSVEGTVEEVGFRSTRVRTFYDSIVTVPNSTVASSLVDNMGRRRYRRFKIVLGLSMSTTADQMERFVEGLRQSILDSPRTRKDYMEIHFHTIGEYSMDVLVYAFFEVETWTDELRGRQELQLAWLKLAEDLGIELAYPTRTLQVTKTAASAEYP